MQTLLNAGKEYVALMHLHKEVPEQVIRDCIKNDFLGKIKQVPPIRSAVKRRLRTRTIYYLEIMEVEGKEVLFKVGCEAGTYIRKLIHDIGLKLRTGAHMTQLVRTKAGPFSSHDWHSLHDLKDAYEFYKDGDEKPIREVILPVEKAVDHLAKVWVVDNCVDSLCHGADLSVPGVSKYTDFEEDETIAVMSLKDELICLGTSTCNSRELSKNDKGKVVSTHKVFMERKTYPVFKRD